MKYKNLELNHKEAQVLINLLDTAVKAQGLNAAQSALYFVDKLQKLFNEEMPKEKVVKETKK